ncbi:MAG: hypothetical protein WAK93_18865, partial [Solirubrobacteraceae bacterium]
MPSTALAQQTLLSEPFTGATTSAPVFGLADDSSGSNSAGLPCLTAGTDSASTPIAGCALDTPDPAGSGTLRLTDATDTQASAVVYNSTFPSSEGLNITFDQYQWGGSGADGILFALAVAPPSPDAVGASGGGLGYTSAGGSVPGLPFGYLGVGLDAFGNYSNTVSDGTGCMDPSWAGQSADQVTIRGPGNGAAGYCLLTSSLAQSPDPMDNIQLHNDSSRTASEQIVNIEIDPSAGANGTVTVSLKAPGDSDFTEVATGPLPSTYYDPATGDQVTGRPPRLTFAFAASTGAATDNHEISNVNVSTLNGAVPTLELAKTDSGDGRAVAGGTLTYRLTAGVPAASPASETEANTVTVTDPLPDGETLAQAPSGAGWNCAASTTSTVSCTNTSTAAVDPGATLPPISVPVRIPTSASGKISNTAHVVSDDAASPASATDTDTITPRTSGGGGTSTSTPALVASLSPVSNTSSNASFSEIIDPDGLVTEGHFEYGLDPRYSGGGPIAYDQSTPSAPVGSDFGYHTFTQSVSGLLPNALYHVRFVASNADGSVTGPDETFTTAADPTPSAPTHGETVNVTPVSGV